MCLCNCVCSRAGTRSASIHSASGFSSSSPQTGVTSGRWQPQLMDGGQSFSPTPTGGTEYTFNATIEPDCDHDGLGDETQDPDISSCNPKPKDTTPPNTTIGKGPKKVIHAKGPKTRVKFTFSSTEVGSTFKCKLDKKAFAACTSPKTYKVKPGKHTFQVEAVDAAGNIDATPAKSGSPMKGRPNPFPRGRIADSLAQPTVGQWPNDIYPGQISRTSTVPSGAPDLGDGFVPVHERTTVGHRAHTLYGSAASRRPSPMKLNAMIVMTTNAAGHISQGFL